MEQKKDSDWSADVQQMVQRMMHFNEVLLDYMQAQTLENLDRGQRLVFNCLLSIWCFLWSSG